jgi:hypothetical protein
MSLRTPTLSWYQVGYFAQLLPLVHSVHSRQGHDRGDKYRLFAPRRVLEGLAKLEPGVEHFHNRVWGDALDAVKRYYGVSLLIDKHFYT